MSDDEERWAAVGLWVRRRMAERGWKQIDVCKAAELTPASVRPLEKGVPNTLRPATRSQVALALGGPGDAIDLILAGVTPPDPEPAPNVTDRLRRIEAGQDEIRQELSDLRTDLARLLAGRERPSP